MEQAEDETKCFQGGTGMPMEYGKEMKISRVGVEVSTSAEAMEELRK